MCCCNAPNVNGNPGYRWQPNAEPGIHPVNPPDVPDGATLLIDEPGRCGGIDSHSHHYRVVYNGAHHHLLCRNGSGDHKIRISNGVNVLRAIIPMSSNARYWILNTMYHAARDAALSAELKANGRWTQAAIEKRIKLRRRRGQVRVEIVPAT